METPSSPPQPLPTLWVRLCDHFACDPSKLPVVAQTVENYNRPNLHLALEELIEASNPGPVLLGLITPEHSYGPTLAKLSRPTTAAPFEEGPVEYLDLPLANDQRLACIKQGLYLLKFDGRPAAVLVTAPEFYRPDSGVKVEVMGEDQKAAERVSRKLSRGVARGTAFRGQVLSVEAGCYGGVSVKFHKLRAVSPDELILPADVLRRIERQATGLTRHAERLKAAGRHLKRGILMHGKPGTGKTLSAMYLAARMTGRTVMVLTGGGMGTIEIACQLARLLEPATIVLEDVDLIGTERDHQSVGANALLFELLNQMDGLGEDADILFILTTNRPDHLEPALAARPGRIDLAIEVPLPDDDCRRRLFELYGRGLTLAVHDLEKWVQRTRGVSAAFIREVLRKAAILAAEEGTGELVVTDRHLEEAIAELLVAGGRLTQTLLGVVGNTDNPEV